ncbi:hypothetical protein [Spirulina subsalsa]|uniref:hypothetical protein n=1 Tax=Spirulina subsalsa TaxID=54311 RepID=UPI0008FB69E5|nr:hypothetical protein [Spirulina subsalsa]
MNIFLTETLSLNLSAVPKPVHVISTREWESGNRERGTGNRESGVGNRKSGIGVGAQCLRPRESGVGSRNK